MLHILLPATPFPFGIPIPLMKPPKFVPYEPTWQTCTTDRIVKMRLRRETIEGACALFCSFIPYCRRCSREKTGFVIPIPRRRSEFNVCSGKKRDHLVIPKRQSLFGVSFSPIFLHEQKDGAVGDKRKICRRRQTQTKQIFPHPVYNFHSSAPYYLQKGADANHAGTK